MVTLSGILENVGDGREPVDAKYLSNLNLQIKLGSVLKEAIYDNQ